MLNPTDRSTPTERDTGREGDGRNRTLLSRHVPNGLGIAAAVIASATIAPNTLAEPVMLTTETVRNADDAACADGSPFDHYVERVGDAVQHLVSSKFPVAAGSHMRFVCAPLVHREGSTDVEPGWNRLPAGMSRRIDSPWLVVDATEAAPGRVQLTFHWSERQMLIDQANLADYRNVGQSNAPFAPDEFRHHVADYETSVLLASSPQEREIAQTDIETKIPADLLWLLRQSLQSTRGPFEGFVDDARRHMVEQYFDGYSIMSTHIAEQYFSNPGVVSAVNEINRFGATLPIKDYAVNRTQ